MFLLVTIAGAGLGGIYALTLHRHLSLDDWRLWVALVPLWSWAVGFAVAMQSVNMTDLLPQAIASCAVASFAVTIAQYVKQLRKQDSLS